VRERHTKGRERVTKLERQSVTDKVRERERESETECG